MNELAVLRIPGTSKGEVHVADDASDGRRDRRGLYLMSGLSDIEDDKIILKSHSC
jgi:hypothetical protein